ncbi:hypothetical protein V5O48_006830 [Marasmius crinis-equi]|uniref:Uncharacterized protein n=1 Tax=Marasmius crinis-equi TaxID=585013 RepID=A0ABR3FIL7_9AGAR
MIFKLRPKNSPWEVVGRRSVNPVAAYHEDEEEDLDIMSVRDSDIDRTYVFEVKRSKLHSVARNAILFARQQVLLEISKMGYNDLILEGWKLAVYEREKVHRIEVQYTGRAAHILGKVDQTRRPPFLDEVLHDWAHI